MAMTLEEIVVKLEAENKQFMAAMVSSQKQTATSMEAMQKAIEKMSEDGSKNLNFFQTAMATMTGFLGGQFISEGIDLAKDAAKALFNTFIVDGIAASSEAIDSMNALKFALAQTGQYSKESAEGFADWAGELQKVTKYEDDAIIKSAAFIQTLGKLDQDGLKRATEASMNLASALGIDLETATRMVGKAAAGETGAFSKLGIEIAESADKSVTFANALKAIEALGPAARKEAESYSGALARMNHGFGELQEQTGAAITMNVAVIDVMNHVSDVMFGTADSMDANAQAMRVMVAEGLVAAINATVGLLTVLDALGRIGSAVFNHLQMMAYASLYPTVKLMNLVGLASDEMVETIKIGAVDSAKAIYTSFTEDTALGTAATKFAELGNVAESGLAKVRDGAVALPDPINNTKKATDELSVSMKALVEEGEKLAKSYMEASLSGKAMMEQQLADAQLIRDEKMLQAQLDAEANDFSLTSLRDRKDAEMEIELEYLAAKAAALEEARLSEEEAVLEAFERGKISREEYEAGIKGITQKYDTEERKADLDMAKFKKTVQDNEVKDREAQIQVLAGLLNSQNEYAKGVGKAFAITNTMIKMQEGATSAYSALAGIPIVGPALGIAAAAAVIADGTARLAQIRGAKGGITEVPGIGGSDTFGPVALAPGERVVPGETNQDLKAFLKMAMEGGGMGGGRVEVEISLKDELMDFIEAKLIERGRLGQSLMGA